MVCGLWRTVLAAEKFGLRTTAAPGSVHSMEPGPRREVCGIPVDMIGKTHISQQKLHFDGHRVTNPRESEGVSPSEETGTRSTGSETDLKKILSAVQQSLTKINRKIHALTFRMDCMVEHFDKEAERLDLAERRV
ncbi:hypothetical protein NDU88_007710 [Pleurodeles waltl]|uniref:Uncharacterized protein n=1 Tax=Pleurodeles waltl TaxID=8319 RepID=A0AAV7STH2_PLEWA|nr:hypothetical protein NDU88_007710 [Pleurodeles waltl]